MPELSTCLWFNDNAEEAVNFYVSIFKDAKIKQTTHYGEASANVSGRPKGSVMTVTFEIAGKEYMALNGGPVFNLSPAFSIIVYVDTQEELDYYWNTLSKGGQEMECGWLTDKFGLSWQITPRELDKWTKDPKKYEQVMVALLKMVKLDIAELRRAYEQ